MTPIPDCRKCWNTGMFRAPDATEPDGTVFVVMRVCDCAHGQDDGDQ